MAADQTTQRQNLASQAATACQKFIESLTALMSLGERRPFLGNFVAADFAGTALAYLDPATVATLFDFVVPSLKTNYEDAANGGRNRQVLQQMAPTL